MRKIFIASNNKGKIREIKSILEDYYDYFITPNDLGIEFDVVEDGNTFKENAAKKAVAAMKRFEMDALADDSGLCVDALDGAPGVFSARYSGLGTDDSNNKKLLFELRNTPIESRTARFISVVALCRTDGSILYGSGSADGVILHSPRGDNGFGYDPLFLCTDFNRTYAELTDEEKNSISHRFKALKALRGELSINE